MTTAILQIDKKAQQAMSLVKEKINLEQVAFHLMQLTEFNQEPWDLKTTNQEIDNYFEFLALNLMYPEQKLIPSVSVDKVWHCHILSNTRKYEQDCLSLFGKYFHHQSHYQLSESENEAIIQSQIKTSRLLLLHFDSSNKEYKADCCSPSCQPSFY